MSASPATTSVVALMPATSFEKSKSCFIASPILSSSLGRPCLEKDLPPDLERIVVSPVG
jgi:hypothetical protein